MNRHSITTKITTIFGISVILVCLLFILLTKFQNERNLDLMQERQFQSINYLFRLYENKTPPKDIEAYFNYFGLKRVDNQNLMSSVREQGEVTFQRATTLGGFSSIIYNDRYYLFLENPAIHVLLESQEGKHANDYLWIGFALALFALISTFISTIRSLNPLKDLSLSIRQFASGQMDIECKGDKKDEIAEVANEFDKAVKKIRDLLRSRQLFLRTIMHELKTPIGKGRIVSEMVSGDVQKKRLINIFERLDLLINEFSKIEQLVSKSYTLKVEDYPLSSVVEQACDLLMLDDKQMEERVFVNLCEECNVSVDFDLMTLAIKNLADNALKYSSDKKVRIESIEKGLRISNQGAPLAHSIEYYLEAFVTSGETIDGGRGTGLGLYIVTNILELNKCVLEYSYEEGWHRFDILLNVA